MKDINMEEEKIKQEIEEMKKNPLDEWEKQIDVNEKPVERYFIAVILFIVFALFVSIYIKNNNKNAQKIENEITKLEEEQQQLKEQTEKTIQDFKEAAKIELKNTPK